MDRKDIPVSTSLDPAAREALLEIARRHGLTFARSGRPNESAALRHVAMLGLQIEMGKVAQEVRDAK